MMKMYYKRWIGVCTLAFLSLFITDPNYAQVGHTCDTPLEIATLPYDHAGNMADYGNDYTDADVPPTTPGAITTGTGNSYYLTGEDVVYSYMPEENQVINISTTNSGEWVGLWVFTGCPFGSTLGYHTATNGTSRAINGLSVLANHTYYIVVSNWATTADLNYTIHVEVKVPDCPDLGLSIGDPCDDGNSDTVQDTIDENCDCVGTPVATNDEACTAAVLTCGSEITQSLIGATSSQTDNCNGTGSADVWFTFVSDGSEIYTVSQNTSFDAVVQLFVGDDCGNLSEVEGCVDSPESYTISDGGTYYFRVRPYASMYDEGIIGVSLECVPYDCPDLLANIGDPCDDGNIYTFVDSIDENCDCVGIEPQACVNTSRYPSATVTAGVGLVTISYCNLLQEYSEIDGIIPGAYYTFSGSEYAYITVRTGSADGAVLGMGFPTATVMAPNSDNLFVHWNSGPDCSTDVLGCVTTTVQCLTCPVEFDCPDLEMNFGDDCDDGDPGTIGDHIDESCDCVGIVPQACENSQKWPSATVIAGEEPVTISTCSFLKDYSEIGGIQSGENYTFTVTGNGYITVRTGNPGGDVVGMGFSPLTVTAPDSSKLFAHWNVGPDCSTSTGCVTTAVQCLTCPAVCDEPLPAVEGLWEEYVEGEGMLFHWDPVPNSIGCQFRLYTPDTTLIAKSSSYGFEMDQFLVIQAYFDYATEYIFAIRCGCSVDPITTGPWMGLAFTTPGGAQIASSPNPTSGISNVAFEVAVEEHVTLEVYDMSGRSVEVLYQGMAEPTDAYRFQFDGSGLPAGVYIYRLTTDSEVVIEKFMIAK